MRISRFAVPLLGVLAVVSMAGRLHADPITLGTGSSVSATAHDFNLDQTTTDNVTSLPFVKTTAATAGTASSSVLSNLTTSGFSFSYTQSIPSLDGDAEGKGDMFFTAGAGTTFAIAGSMTSLGIDYTQELAASLFDVTAGSFVYDYDKTVDNFIACGMSVVPETFVSSFMSVSSSTLTLDTTGGALSGALVAGHSYEFIAFQGIDNTNIDPTSSGNITITFAQQAPSGSIPLPLSAAAALLPLALAGAFVLRRRAA